MDDPYIDNATERSMDEKTRKALELARQFLMAPSIFDRMEVLAAIDAALASPAAPVAQPLTDEQIDEAFRSTGFRIITPAEVKTARRSARAIERKHGIGQGGAA